MGAVPNVPPIIPNDRGRGFESGSSAEVLLFRAGSTVGPEDTEASSGTIDELDSAVTGKVSDYKVHGGKAFEVKISAKDGQENKSRRRIFERGSAEHEVLNAMRKYGRKSRDAIKGAAKQTSRIRRK